jgi:hypothetical protein
MERMDLKDLLELSQEIEVLQVLEESLDPQVQQGLDRLEIPDNVGLVFQIQGILDPRVQQAIQVQQV